MAVIRLRLESQSTSLPVDAFTDVLASFRRILRDLNQSLAGAQSGRIQWHISALAMSSPITADLLPLAPSTVDPQLPRMVSANLIAVLRALESGTSVPPYFPESALKSVRRITKHLAGDTLYAIDATYVGQEPMSARITSEAGRNVERLTSPRFQAVGSVTGTLDTVSLHEGQQFQVYDLRTEHPVRCQFQPEDFPSVKEALGHRVRVSGIVHRNFRGDAISIETPVVTVLPDDPEAPKTADISGLAPDFTGDLSVGEYVQWMRDA